MAEPFLGIWQSLVGRAIACVQSVLPALAAAKRGGENSRRPFVFSRLLVDWYWYSCVYILDNTTISGLDAEKAKAVQAKLRETSTILECTKYEPVVGVVL